MLDYDNLPVLKTAKGFVFQYKKLIFIFILSAPVAPHAVLKYVPSQCLAKFPGMYEIR